MTLENVGRMQRSEIRRLETIQTVEYATLLPPYEFQSEEKCVFVA
jgi:hypothetical protein